MDFFWQTFIFALTAVLLWFFSISECLLRHARNNIGPLTTLCTLQSASLMIFSAALEATQTEVSHEAVGRTKKAELTPCEIMTPQAH